MKLIPDCSRKDKMLECISGQQESLRRILSPATSLDTQSAYLLLYICFPPYYPQTVFCLVFQMAHLADNTFDSRGKAFSLKPYQNATFIKSTESLYIYKYIYSTALYCESSFCSYLNINEGQPAKVKCQREY